MEVETALRDSAFLPAVFYGSEIRSLSEGLKLRLRAMKAGYLKSTFEVTWRER